MSAKLIALSVLVASYVSRILPPEIGFAWADVMVVLPPDVVLAPIAVTAEPFRSTV
jgi:hypothetical protein